jgi:propionyl-CoA synthetase|tara:strand:+ start:1313 stop:3202 length:1890 start_codon:yes stop_codon:yes gene_type:complete
MSRYSEIFNQSIENKEVFWNEVAKDVIWYEPYDKVLHTDKPPFYRWYKNGKINTCYNALDRHVDEGNGERLALIYDSPITNSKETFTYSILRDRVAVIAGALKQQGVLKGDRVIIYMPMIPEAVMAMLACARIGAVHSVVFGGFAAAELANRIDDSEAKLILTASCGIEPGRIVEYQPLINEAIKIAKHKPSASIFFQREQKKIVLENNQLDWNDFIKNIDPAECEVMDANDPAYILYTSGTTGTPKGIVRDIGGHIVALKWTMKNVYNIDPGDVWWSASDIGWIVGHSYIVYAPLFHGCTTVLFEGKPVGTPDAGEFWRIISEYKVKTLFTAPTAFRAIKKEDPEGKFFKKHDLSNFESLFLAGERADPDTIKWAEDLLHKPVIDHWWQTETSWAITANCAGLGLFPTKYGSAGKPVPGYNVKVLQSDGTECAVGEMGDVVVELPLPPGTFPTLWNADARYEENYMSTYPGYYQTYDAGYIDADGDVWIMSRTDDIINVAGHRLSTGAMEEVLSEHPDVAECAVVGIADKLKGQLPLGFVVLKNGTTNSDEVITTECIKMIREKLGPVAAFKKALVLKRLPKTRSGKVLRGIIRKIVDKESFSLPPTIDDPLILDEIKDSLIHAGIID